MSRNTFLVVITVLFAEGCTRPPAEKPAIVAVRAAPPSSAATATPPSAAPAEGVAPDAPVSDVPVNEHLAEARNAELPVGTRAGALQMYARDERDGDRGEEAARLIFAFKGQIMTPFGDSMYDALGMLGSPSAIPLLLSTGELGRCEGADVPSQRITPETLKDPKATITLDLNAVTMTMATLFTLIRHSPDSPEAARAVPELVQALRCGDERIRILAGQSIGNVHRLAPPDAEALRQLIQTHPRAHTRGLAATLVALSPEPPTPAVLDKALADPDEFVQLMSATALVRLSRRDRAVPLLRRLSRSKNADIASTAKTVLANPPPAP